jgi:hypothetical protein
MRRRALAGVVAGLVAGFMVLTACSGSDGPKGTDGALPASLRGLLLMDCWHDTATVLNPKTATLENKYALARTSQKDVSLPSFCNQSYGSQYGSGMSVISPDRRLLASQRRFDDGGRHVGYSDAASGKFIDMSTRLKLNANGEFTDKGSGADDFAGPIMDTTVGFGPDGTYYLERADKVYAAKAPLYAEFTAVSGDPLIGTRSAGGRAATVRNGREPQVEVPAGTPDIAAYRPEAKAETVDARYAPLGFDRADQSAGSSCYGVDWIDADHLLCRGSSSGGPKVISLVGATLTPAATYVKANSCSCDNRQYVMVLPAGAVTNLVPKTQRELTGFVVRPGAGTVVFLASSGSDLLLYEATLQSGATPTKLGTFKAPDGTPSGVSYLSLQWR